MSEPVLAPVFTMLPSATTARTLRELAPVFLRWFSLIRRRSENTVRAYEADLDAFLRFAEDAGFTHPGEVRVQHVEFYMGLLLEQHDLQPASVNRHLHALRSFWKWMQREGIATDNPPALAYRLKEPKKLPDYLTIPEQERLLDALSRNMSPAGVRDYVLHAIGLFAGLRCSELANLRLEHVNTESGILRVVAGKGAKDREVPITPPLALIVCDYLTRARPILLADRPSPYLFVRVNTWGTRHQGEALGPKAIFYVVRRTIRSVLGPERAAHPHVLRHSFASRIREHGGGLQDLQEAMGHSNIATTARYSHLVTSSQRRRLAGLIEGIETRERLRDRPGQELP